MDDQCQPDRQLNRVLAVAEWTDQPQTAFEPADEQLNLPAPQLPLDDLLGRQIPAIRQQVIAHRCRLPPRRGWGRRDGGADDTHLLQDGAGPIVGAPDRQPAIALDLDAATTVGWQRRQRLLDRHVRDLGQRRLRVEPGHDVDASRPQAGEAGMAVDAEIEHERRLG